MQEEIEQKSFNIMISTTKLSARTVLRAVKAAFRLYQSKTSQGKQSVRTLLRQNRGVSSVEISKTGIDLFASVVQDDHMVLPTVSIAGSFQRQKAHQKS